jgi:hypothetical protein
MGEHMTDRMNQLNNELRDLYDELESLQKRALRRVEEIENEFQWVELPEAAKKNFLIMRRLITKVG